jgi:Chlamydia polymorphic membrane protein (Chlamydia_PMP) repeat
MKAIALMEVIHMNKWLFTYVVILVIPVVCLSAVLHVPAEYDTIQAGIDAAGFSDIVLVENGVYRFAGNIDLDLKGKYITVMSENGPSNCIIDCEGSESVPHRGFFCGSNESDLTVIRGFTIRDGYADFGSGIFCYGSSPTIMECIFFNNTATDSGGGINCWDSNAKIFDCVFDDNSAYSGGGASFQGSTNAIVTNCTFMFGTAYYSGAVTCNTITAPFFFNCYFHNNVCTAGGGFYIAHNASPTLINCTISDNTATYGAGLHMLNANATVVNTILWGNSPYEIDVQSGSPPDISFSNIYQDSGVYAGEGNINADPLFVDPTAYDYRLTQIAAGQSTDSPCVDTGNEPADEICFPSFQGQVCMDEMSTRTDDGYDAGTVDMGFHYAGDSAPTPTPTPSDCTITGTTLWMPDTTFLPGENCSCHVSVCNATGSVLNNYPLFVVLDVYGSYYFAPSFSAFDNYLSLYSQFTAGLTVVEVLPAFIWPTGAGSASGIVWYSALTDPGMTQLFGEMDMWTFGWGT